MWFLQKHAVKNYFTAKMRINCSHFRPYYSNYITQINPYDHLVRLCLQQCDQVKARQVFDEMPQRIFQAFTICRLIHGRSLILGFQLDGQLGNAVLDLYSKCGNARYSTRVFEMLENRTVQSWNSILSLNLRNEKLDNVGKLFGTMRNSSVMPNAFTYAIVLSMCGLRNSSVMPNAFTYDIFGNWFGKQLHCDVLKTGFLVHSFCEGSLTDMYVKCGCFVDARRMFSEKFQGMRGRREMKEENGIFFNATSAPTHQPVNFNLV